MHPKNRHQGQYDFALLTKHVPALSAWLRLLPNQTTSIDFANVDAVRALNQALLASHYGIRHWSLPEGYLCPPVPGRADYLHGLSDLLAAQKEPPIRVLDVGVGANCIYPLIGQAEFGWSFVGSEVDPKALEIAQSNVEANQLQGCIELRLQSNRGKIFHGVIQPNDRFTLTLCNPPFHASAKDAALSQQRKWAGLGLDRAGANFGGQDAELWCTGGEASYIKRMVRESADFASQVGWFSTLVSKSENLPDIYKHLKKVAAAEVCTIAMEQGSKQSRFVAWRFQQ